MKKDAKRLRFLTKKSFKEKQLPYFEQHSYYDSDPAIWMCREDETHQLCEGYWLLTHGTKGPFERINFTAADPHWVKIWYKNFPDQDIKDFEDFMDQNKIIWR